MKFLPHLVYIYIYIYTHLLTPWRRVLLEKLTDFQLVKKFPAFHGTRRFITALKSVRHLSLSWASLIQFVYIYRHRYVYIYIHTHTHIHTYIIHTYIHISVCVSFARKG